MPELKIKLKDPGAIHLMALDTSSEFLPFGRPVSDYLRGTEGNQNGSRALLNQGPMRFSPAIRWNESIGALLRTTGFSGSEQEEVIEPVAAPVEPPDPAVADFLPFESPAFAWSEENPTKVSPAMALEDLPISIPRVAALPLRPRMTFGPPPAPKAKPVPVAPPKAAAPAPVAKATPVVAAPPKPVPAAPPKAAAPIAAPKPPAPAPVQAKPAAAVPPAPRSSPAPTQTRVTVPQAPVVTAKPIAPQAPAARAPEATPAPPKPTQTPTRVNVPRPSENVASAVDAAVATPPKAAPPQAKAPAAVVTPKPPAPPVPARGATSTASPVEQAPAREVISREIPKEKEPEPRPKSAPVENVPATGFEPHLGGAETTSFFERIPMVAKIGAAGVAVALALYLTMGGKTAEKPAESSAAVNVGEQGWTTEWASDIGGSKRARQLTMYRPSAGMSDYQLQFVGQIETKALGWVFRAFDTKNYYVMKIEAFKPGVMALTHFAVVEGRESSYSQKPLSIDARPGAAYRVKLEVNGPRFTVSIGGEPVDFWTDNRLKVGSVGFMNERDERGAASSVQFSFPKVAK